MKNYAKNILTRIFIRQASLILQKYNPKIVVVAGSVGKTSTKLAIASVLSKKFKVQYENGNYNVPLSVPFVITGQRLPEIYNIFGWLKAWAAGQKVLKTGFDYEVVVLEYGIDHIGEMQEFAPICKPDISVITGIAPEHMEFFKTLDAVAKEELHLTNFSKKVLINADLIDQQYIDDYVSKDVELVKFGRHNLNSEFVVEPARTAEGAFSLNITDKNRSSLFIPNTNIVGEHSISGLAAAAVVAEYLGVASGQIIEALAEYTSPAGRMNMLNGQHNSKIIDDTYNSSPTAAIAALNTLYELPGTKKITLLGNMNELGQYSTQAHQQIGQHCDPKKLDLVVTLAGDANTYLAEAAETNGCRVIKTTSPIEAGKIIAEELQDGCVVLAKGSQNKVFAEEAVKIILANPEDSTKLVRQSANWLAKKRQQFPDMG